MSRGPQLASAIVGLLWLLAGPLAPVVRGAYAAADVEPGKKLFQMMCVTCHGFNGTGGNAPPLNRARLERAPDDDALRQILAVGVPERGMPRIRRMSDNEQRQLVAYIRSLGAIETKPTKGNPQRGAESFARLGCATCHIVNGQGGSFGPELSTIGRLRGSDYLRQALLEPGAALPMGALVVSAGGYSDYLPVQVVTREGEEVKGYRVNEDTFTLQVRDMANQLHSYRKSNLKRIERPPGTSLMPDLAKQLSAAEVDDLVAYLSNLLGSP